jgi:hypothetical protein
MLCRVKMFGRMLIFGRIAAANMAARQAETQVDPGVSHLETFFAAIGIRLRVVGLF